MVHLIKSESEFKEVIASGKVVVDFFATWCPPCQRIGPEIETLDPKYPSVKIYKLDVDEFPDLTKEYEVKYKPTFKFFVDGKLVETIEGAYLEKITESLDSLSK